MTGSEHVADERNAADQTAAEGSGALPPRRELTPAARNTIAAVVIIAGLVGLFFLDRLAVTGDSKTSQALPESVDRLIPESGDEVLAQNTVGIDLAIGYDAYLVINGTEIRDEDGGLVKDMGTGLITFQPAPGAAVEALQPEQNCVVAMIWDQTVGPKSAEPLRWCFTAA